MRKLEKTFGKNGLIYQMIKRTKRVVLFKLFVKEWTGNKKHVGWEVSKIQANEERIIDGRDIESGESITGNDTFGKDGSKAFFPRDKEDAFNYFGIFSKRLGKRKPVKLAV